MVPGPSTYTSTDYIPKALRTHIIIYEGISAQAVGIGLGCFRDTVQARAQWLRALRGSIRSRLS